MMEYTIIYLYAFIVAILTNIKAGLQMSAMLERKDTTDQPNSTLKVTVTENEDQPTSNKHTLGQEAERTTLLDSLFTGNNSTATVKPLQGVNQLNTDCVTSVFNLIATVTSDDDLAIDKTTQGAMCDEPSVNKTYPMNNPPLLNPNEMYGALTLMIIGSIVVTLNLIVIVVAYSSKKLRRNTYINLVLTLSVNDFLFGLSTFLTGTRVLPFDLFKSSGLCIFTLVISPTCLIMTLYQSFLISLHRFIVISGSNWVNILFNENRHYVLYICGWIMVVTSLSSLISPIPNEVEYNCKPGTVFNKNEDIAMFIIILLECVFMLSTLVFYFSAMISFKRNYLNMSKSTISNTILENRRKKLSTSMRSVGILLLAMFILSGPFLVRNVLEMIQPISGPVLLITFVLTNVNSLLNPPIYFIKIVEFKMVLKRLWVKSGTVTDDSV